MSAPQTEEQLLLGHSYDGIQEYDNPLPGWWRFLFWVSIIFAPIYYFYFHFGVDGRSIHDQYETAHGQYFRIAFPGDWRTAAGSGKRS